MDSTVTVTTTTTSSTQQTGSAHAPAKNTEQDNDEVSPKFCCLRGCMSTSIIAFLFFVMLPSGILLILYSDKNDNPRILPIGIVLVCLPFIMTSAVVYVLLQRKRVKSWVTRLKWWS